MSAHLSARSPEPAASAVSAHRLLRLAFAGAALAACAPELDWRELSLPDGCFSVLLPCKPQRETRTLNTAAGARAPVGMADIDLFLSSFKLSS